MKRGHAPSSADVWSLLAANVLWSSTYVVGRGILETAPPLVLAFARFVLASGFMLLLGMARRPPLPPGADADSSVPRSGALLSLAVTGVVGFGLAKLLTYEGLARSTATDAALIVNLEAVFTALLAALLLRQRLGAPQWAGVLVACAGGAALVWPAGPLLDAGHRTLGNALLIGSVAAEALASVLGARAMRRYSPLQVTAYATFWGTAFLLPLAAWQWRADGYSLAWLTPANVAALVYLAAGATVLAYVLWYRALERVDAGRVAVFLYVQPVVGVLLGIALRREWPTWLGAAGGGLVLLGIYLTSRPSAPE
jgi:drug/metabolite transporter (DMT)-like permease